MLIKIIIKNINVKNYMLYLISSSLLVMIIEVLMTLLIINDAINLGGNSENVKIIISLYYIIVVLVGFNFLVYALSFYTRTRIYDYGLLLVLGIKKKMLFSIIFIEYLVIYLLSLLLGTFVGNVILQVLMFIFRIYGNEVYIEFQDIWGVFCRITIISFGVFIISYFFVFLRLRKGDFTKKLSSNVKKERKHEKLGIIGFVGLMLLFKGISNLNEPTFTSILISMIVCFIGIYIILSFGGSGLLIFLKKYMRNIYLKNMLILIYFYFRFKSNRKIMYIVFLMNFIIVFIVGGITIATVKQEDFNLEYPYDLVSICYNDSESSVIREVLQNDYIKLDAVKGYFNLDSLNKGINESICIFVDDYNKLMGENLFLEHNEAIIVNQSFEEEKNKDYFKSVKIPTNIGVLDLDVVEHRNEIIFG